MISYDYKPTGVCSRNIHVDLNDAADTIEGVTFTGGCDGNLRAIGKLVAGQRVDDIVSMLAGNDCKGRGTSCADQLTRALLAARKSQAETATSIASA